MIKYISSWTQGIILAVIIATIIEIILPEGNNKKYVKTIIGIYVLFVIVYPLISSISSKNIDIESIIDNTNNQMSSRDINNNIIIATNGYIEETYKQSLEDEIIQKANEKGYEVNSLNLYIETDDDGSYGQIDSIVMQISKKTELENSYEDIQNYTENKINTVQEVVVTISNNNSSNKANDVKQENILEEEIISFKEYLNTVYGVEKERIHINE